MKSLPLCILPQLCTLFHKYFPQKCQDQLWRQCQPLGYDYQIKPGGLVLGLMMAYLARASGLRQLTERHGELIGTTQFSSLSPALSRPVTLLFVRALRATLEEFWTPGPLALVALDSMALTLKKGYRHRCQSFNGSAVGGGVIWAFLIDAAAGVCPVKLLDLVQGAWSDVKQMRKLPLLSVGPLYLMDRGFYALDLLEQWLGAGVHFIVRVKRGRLRYDPLCTLSPPRKLGSLTLEWDGLAWLGAPTAKHRPRVRLVVARLASGEELILASDQWLWSAEQILAAYKKRWQIERFHKLLKDALGLSHLYNFSATGLEVQLQAALLLAVLAYLGETPQAGEAVIVVMRRAVRGLRRQLGLDTPWRRNACSVTFAKKKPNRKWVHRKKQKTVKR